MSNFRIEGDGTWNSTKVYYDGALITATKSIKIVVTPKHTWVVVDGKVGDIEFIFLNGVYKLIGQGKFDNTKLFINDEELRGIQGFELYIGKDKAAEMRIKAVFLPHILVNDA
jgi:hypothetical protein